MRAWQPTLVFLPEESPWTEEPGGLQSMGSRQNLVNGGDYMTVLLQGFHWDVGIMEGASANL